jgi:hypothetical protein
MTTQLLFYKEAAPVTFDRHREIYVKTGGTYDFARNVNSVPITAIEFAQAAAEYPIVFAGTDEAVMPAVILGAQQTENLFVDTAGAWRGKYVPAFVRRYPFVFSTDEAGKRFILHIDESFDGVNREGRGERLFDNDGEQTHYLKGVLRFLQDYQARFHRTREYCARLKSLGLLQPMQAKFNLADGNQRSLSGFSVVDREKLKAVSADDLTLMFQNDELECTYLHLHSLRHFGDMIDRMPATDLPATEPPAAEQSAVAGVDQEMPAVEAAPAKSGRKNGASEAA